MASRCLLIISDPSVVLHTSISRRISMAHLSPTQFSVSSLGTLLTTTNGDFGIWICIRKSFLIVLYSANQCFHFANLVCYRQVYRPFPNSQHSCSQSSSHCHIPLTAQSPCCACSTQKSSSPTLTPTDHPHPISSCSSVLTCA